MRIPAPGEQVPGKTRTLLTDAGGSKVRRTVLPDGHRIITESMPGARSASVGIWAGVGSRDESPALAGASHFLEHLLFKGTERRTAFEISAAVEAVGGDLNAFTTKENTCFHARVLPEDLPMVIDVLADMVVSSVIDPGEFATERPVIIEEIAMYGDDPSDVAQQSFAARAFGRSPLARPVIGTVDSIQAMSRAGVVRHYRRHYQPRHLVITVAGGIDHGDVVRAARKAMAVAETAEPAAARTAGARAPRDAAVTPEQHVVHRPTEQAHLVLGFPGLSRTDERRWALAALDVLLGGGMSSRLFQEVREKRGLTYAVQSFRSSYSDAGTWGVYAGCSPDKADETVAVVRDVLAEIARTGAGDEEIARAKGQLRGQTVLELEDPTARMGRLGEAELLTGELLGLDDILARLDAVSSVDVSAIAHHVLSGPEVLSVVGPFKPGRKFGLRRRSR